LWAREGVRPRRMSDAKVKEARPTRVGLSYNCKYCGQPKKGHVCLLKPGAGAAAPASTKPKKAAEEKKKASAKGEGKGGASGGAKAGEGSASAAADVADDKDVLPLPLPGNSDGDGEMQAKAGGKSSGAKRRASQGGSKSAKRAAPASPVLAHSVSASTTKTEVTAEDAALLADLEFDHNTQRPPSLITPEDVTHHYEAARGAPLSSMMSSMMAPPASLASATNAFTPGQLMNNMFSPPAITPGLSPGTLDALGSVLVSPSPALRSTRSVRYAAQS